MDQRICPKCLKDLSEDRHTNALYCSKKCKHQSEGDRARDRYVSIRKTECIYCGDKIPQDRNFSAKYCSYICRMVASNERRNVLRDKRRFERGGEEKKQPTEFDRKYSRRAPSLNKHGWTIVEWVIYNCAQNGKCAICQKSNYEQGLDRELAADHDHNTGDSRALVCFKCNILLGHSNDDVDILQSAISYINRYKSSASISSLL